MNKDLHTDPGGHSGIHEDLLVKHLLGEADPDEHARVEAWLEADPANRHFYDHFRLIWRESRRLGDNVRETDDQEEQAWQKFRQKIHRPSHLQPVQDTPAPRQWSFPTWSKVAAVLILAAFIYLLRHRTSAEQTIASNAAVITDTLPDGSAITLNRQSKISYPSRFEGSERTVRLEGEAFFKIAPNKEKPFKVFTNGITITVLGTSFNVHNKSTGTEIIVETGLVLVTDSLHSILLHPSEKLILRNGDASLTRDSTRNELYKYYRTREFVCDNTSLEQLAVALEEAYDVKITIDDPALRQLRINTVFREESLDQILSVIKETFRIRIARSGRQIDIQP